MPTRVQVAQLVEALLDLDFGGECVLRLDPFDRHLRVLPDAVEDGAEAAGTQDVLVAPVVGGIAQFGVADARYLAKQFKHQAFVLLPSEKRGERTCLVHRKIDNDLIVITVQHKVLQIKFTVTKIKIPFLSIKKEIL